MQFFRLSASWWLGLFWRVQTVVVRDGGPRGRRGHERPRVGREIPTFFCTLHGRRTRHTGFQFFHLLRTTTFRRTQRQTSDPGDQILLGPYHLFLGRGHTGTYPHSSFTVLFHTRRGTFLVRQQFFPSCTLLGLRNRRQTGRQWTSTQTGRAGHQFWYHWRQRQASTDTRKQWRRWGLYLGP